MSYSQGFNPHPRFSFGPSLRTGWEGRDEYLDAWLERPCEDLRERCLGCLPEGLRVVEAARVAPGVPMLSADVTGARYRLSLAPSDVYEPRAGVPRYPGDLRPGERAQTEQWKSDVRGALASAIRERFASPEGGSDGSREEPVVLEVHCFEEGAGADALVVVEYLSTMHGGKSLFPEDILTPFLGGPAGYGTPIRVERTALYVERAGALVSPMSRVALETAA